MPKYLVFGDEPFLIDKMRSKLRSDIKSPEFNLLESDEFSDIEIRFLNQYPLFESKKVFIFYGSKMKDCETLVDYLSTMKRDIVHTYIFIKEVDCRTKIYKKFTAEEIVQCNKVSQNMLEKTILQFIKKKGCEIKTEAFSLLLQRLNYDSEETNLYDVMHALEQICSNGIITDEVVEKIVVDRETENVFLLIRLISEGRRKELFHQADLIRLQNSGNCIGILSLLLRNYRIAYKMQVCGCTLAEVGVSPRTYTPRLSATKCNQAMNVLDETVTKIKTGFYSQDIALITALGKLCALHEN